jgi:hypothetical protein
VNKMAGCNLWGKGRTVNRKNHRNVACWRVVAAVLAVLLVLIASVPGLAQTGPETMNFQGRLLDGDGNPVTEPRCMRFRLCSDADCLESPWPLPAAEFEYYLVTPEVGTYKAGLFTVALGSVHAIESALLYDRDALFLEMGVAPAADPCSILPSEEWETMLPRSQLRASAYAQRSRRVRTTESDNAPLIEVINTGSGEAVYGQTASTTGGVAAGYFEAVGATGQTYGVSAKSASGIGVRGIGGGPSGQVPSGKVGVWGDTSDGTGVLGYSSSTTANMAGVAGWATAASGQTYGVWGSTSSDGGYGVYGTGTQIGVRGVGGTQSGTSASDAVGVWGDSHDGTGVLGYTSGTTGQAGVAGWANASSGEAYGVYGRSLSDGGMGVYGTATTTGTVGIATGSDGQTRGVYGQADSPLGDGVRGEGAYRGVYGEGTDPSGITYGVYGTSNGNNGYGVWGQSLHRDGVYGASTNGNGVFGSTASSGNGKAGVYGVATATGGETYGVYGQAMSSDGYGIYSLGDAHVAGALSWTAITSYISIGPTGFDYYVGYGTDPEITWSEIEPPSGCTPDQMFGYVAHLQLPHQAKLTSVTFYWRDDSPTQDSRLRFMRPDLLGGSPLILAEMYTSGNAGTPSSTTHTWVIGDPVATVNNATNTYLLDLELYCNTRFYAAVIEYTISEPY